MRRLFSMFLVAFRVVLVGICAVTVLCLSWVFFFFFCLKMYSTLIVSIKINFERKSSLEN